MPKDHPAMGFILSNMMANFFGLGNAATPLGIKAMEHLKELNGGQGFSKPFDDYVSCSEYVSDYPYPDNCHFHSDDV
ncbi:hypothetical protein GCM10020331_068420 [Ectobacillus funiculus]